MHSHFFNVLHCLCYGDNYRGSVSIKPVSKALYLCISLELLAPDLEGLKPGFANPFSVYYSGNSIVNERWRITILRGPLSE